MNPSIEKLANSIRTIYARGPDQAEHAIEAFLTEELKGLDADALSAVLTQLADVFPAARAGMPEGAGDDARHRLVKLLLGHDVSVRGLGAEELLKRMAESMNTVFTMLNDLIRLIDANLGGSTAGDETIRHIIGGSLSGETGERTIEEHLGRIKRAFLAAQQSSRDAARTLAGYIISELDPKAMEPQGGGFKIGPLKKAEGFDLFEEKYKRVRKWYDSERFLLDFLREFEKNCRKSYS